MGKKRRQAQRTPPKKMRWVSLHNHTTFSYGDGFGPVRTHVKRIHDLGMTAVSSTEHGNTSAHAQLEKYCNEFNVKPIFGCEIYCGPTDPDNPWLSQKTVKWHQTVLAMNQTGLQNLNRLVSASWRDNHNMRFPTVSAAMLEEYSEGLIVLSGCADSFLSCTLLGGKSNGPRRDSYTTDDFNNARRVIEWYQSILGDRYYIEVQRFPGLERTCQLNPAFEKLSRITGAPLVATADVHYPFPEDNKMQRILHAAHRGGTVESADASWEYDILLTYPTSDQEIFEDLIGTGLSPSAARRAIIETEKIADRCNVVLPKNEPIRWIFDEDKYTTIEEYLWDRLREGWDFRQAYNKHMRKHENEYVDRLKYEMELIVPKGFCDYMAMLSYLISWAKDHKIAVGPARGSAAASLVCYLLRITEIDPMQFPTMLFSRFIDPSRMDLPDVDIDFQDDRRHEVVEEAQRVFGIDRVGNIGNFMRYRGRNSIDDIARVYRVPKWAAETVKNLIVERSGGDARQSESLEDTFKMFPKAREMAKNFPALKLAKQLEGNYRTLSVHAAGIVISNAPISDTCAVYTRTKDGKTQSVVAYDKKDAEYVGMLKADFLGLKTMGMIGICLDVIQMDLEDLYRVPIDEQRTLDAFRANDLTGIFQFEGRATAIVNRDVEPDNFFHLADINALSRPGPLFSGMTAQYTAVKHGRERAERLHPVVDNITSWTYGQIVYQEQVLKILTELAGFSAVRVGDIRRIISQKLGQMVMANAYEEFVDGCRTRHSIKEKLARRIWNFISTSSTYSFNQSHSVSYAMLAFWCMYLKQYHPTAFYSAQLSKVGDSKSSLYKRGKLMQDAIRHSVSILPPDIERSNAHWTADVGRREVLAGFMQVHGIGPATTKNILEWRKNALWIEPTRDLSWQDTIEVHGIGPKTIEKVIDFVNDEDPFKINHVSKVLEYYRKKVWQASLSGGEVPMPDTHSTEMPPTGSHYVIWMGMVRNRNMKDYVEATRTRTGKDVEEIVREMKDPELRKSCVLQCYDEGDEDVYVRFNRWDFPKVEKDLEDIVMDEDVIVTVGQKKEGFGISINAKDIWVIDGSNFAKEVLGADEEEEEDDLYSE